MLHNLLQDCTIVLGSNSPRRKQYLSELGIPCINRASDIDETYPDTLHKQEITDFIAIAKSEAIAIENSKEIIITSDTLVWNDNTALGKPANREEAYQMIKSMSDKTHEVISSVCLRSTQKQRVFNVTTKVTFTVLTDQMIYYYIDTYKPFDKAGAYGIQEWIGLVGITKIDGSYTNIVGLPTTELVQELLQFIQN